MTSPTAQPGAGVAPGPALPGVLILVPSDRMRAWVPQLAEALRQRGLRVDLMRPVAPCMADPPLPSEGLERRLFAGGRLDLSAWMPTADLPGAAEADWAGSLVVNATGRAPTSLPDPAQSARILSPVFHGRFEVAGLAGPLLGGTSPHLGVLAGGRDACRLLQGVHLALPVRDALAQALDAVFGRTITLVCMAVEQLLDQRPAPPVVAPMPPAAPPLSVPGYWPRRLGSALLPKLARRGTRPVLRHEDWCIGYREAAGAGSPLDLSLDPASFRIVATSPDRFYADPVVFAHDGTTAIFFEDYDYATGRGRISHLVVGPGGAQGAPVTTLTRPYHLSYPFVFGFDDKALMIPETSEARTVELYEAEAFPDRWRLRAVLLQDIEAADTTLHFDRRTGLWWMFAAVTEHGSSSHDTLSLFHSDRIEGPWRPHPMNPVKLDPLSSRPAGPLVEWEGRLFRPAQDCTTSYGSGLVWCEILALSPHAFEETVVARHAAPPGYTGLHTYGRGSGFEVVDFKRRRWRFGGQGAAGP